jgi:ribosomal protein L12E/L44/L45/RPP1/RPP2
MFGFLKKLFGGDSETNKEAGVQIEQAATPYKVEPPVINKVEEVNAQPVVKVEKTAPAAPKSSKKSATKKAPAKKEGAKKSTGTRGRKPKAKQ